MQLRFDRAINMVFNVIVHNKIQPLKKGTFIAESNPAVEVFEARKLYKR